MLAHRQQNRIERYAELVFEFGGRRLPLRVDCRESSRAPRRHFLDPDRSGTEVVSSAGRHRPAGRDRAEWGRVGPGSRHL